MKLLCRPVVGIYRVSHTLSSRSHSQSAFKDGGRQWPDLAEICRSGKVPEYFNFASDVFEKQVVTRPDHTALWFDDNKNDQKWSFSQLCTESIRSALAINSVLDPAAQSASSVLKSPIILALLPRVPEWWFIYLGTIRLGAIFCPGTIQLTSEDIKFRLEVSRAEIIITDEANRDKVDEACRNVDKTKKGTEFLKKILIDSPTQKGKANNDWIPYSSLLDKVTDSDILHFRDAKTKSEAFAQAFFTSGTTGKPKLVAHTHVSYGIGHWKTSYVFGLNETDIHWCPCDTGWALSSYCSFFSSWISGSTVYINQMPKFEPEALLNSIQAKPITVFTAPLTIYKAMLQIKDDSLFQFKNLRTCVSAGEPVNPETVKQWKKRTGRTIISAYGQTEMTGMGGDFPQIESSFGNPSKQYDLRIVGKDVEECPPLSEGDIAVKVKPVHPVGLFKGYITEGTDGPMWDTEKNNSSFVGDYYLTGDKGFRDEKGNFFFVSRADDVITSSGYRIGPFEVESAIQTHPAVVESAAVGSPDAQRGEVVKAFIVLTDEVKYRKDLDKRKLAKEIQEHVKKHTAPYKYPRKVEFVDSLPKTISGKILRRELKKLEYS